jgi:hypothetical protein
MKTAALKPKASAGRVKKREKAKPATDLVVDNNSEAYKTAIDAYKNGTRVRTKDMSREEFERLLLGK